MATTAAKEKKDDVIVDAHPNWTGPNATFKKYPGYAQFCKAEIAVQSSICTQTTVRVFGPHGTGKTAIMAGQATAVAAALGYENAKVVVIPAYTISPDDLVSAAPVRISAEDAIEMHLVEIISSQVTVGEPYVLIVDDSLQASPLVQNQLMQLAAEWRLAGFDLRSYGCIGVVFIDNPSLAETATSMDDLAQADRFIVFEVTDQDTAPAVKLHLANKYASLDLTEAFAVRDSLPKEIRHILSWRAFDQMIDSLVNRLPGHWALPYVDGSYQWLALTDDSGRTVDRTKEVVSKLASAVGVPYIETVHRPVDAAIEAAIKYGWSVRIIGPHGAGKTELVKAKAAEAGVKLVTYSLPVTDFDMLVCPVPTPDGRLEMLLSEQLANPEPKLVFVDEASRPKDLLSFVRGNELIHENSLGGVKIPALVGVVAAENPPEFLGRRYDVSGGNISHADRYEITVVMDYADVDSYGWLVSSLPEKMATQMPHLYGHRTDEIRTVAELVVEWHRSDLDNDGRAWVSPRNLERMVRSYMMNVPLENTKLWLGEGERAPVSLTLLEARLAGREMTGLRELTANVDEWEAKLAAASAVDTGLAATDAVHSAFVNADTELLWEHAETVVRLVKYMPPMLKVVYFNVDDPDRQRFWMTAVGVAFGKAPISDIEKARAARAKK